MYVSFIPRSMNDGVLYMSHVFVIVSRGLDGVTWLRRLVYVVSFIYRLSFRRCHADPLLINCCAIPVVCNSCFIS